MGSVVNSELHVLETVSYLGPGQAVELTLKNGELFHEDFQLFDVSLFCYLADIQEFSHFEDLFHSQCLHVHIQIVELVLY